MGENQKPKLNIFQKLDKFGDLFILNLLFVVCCIPIFTIGAAISAVYSYTLKMVRDEENTIWKGYWRAFRANFKQATQAWLVVLVIVGILYVELMLSYSMTGMGLAFIMAVMAIEAIYLSFTLPLLFPLIVRYENTTRNMFKNAFLLSVSNLGTWFYLFFIWVLPVAVFVSNKKVFYYAGFLWICILVSVLAYASSMVLNRLFDKIEGQNQEETKEAPKTISSLANAVGEQADAEELDADESAEDNKSSDHAAVDNTFEGNVDAREADVEETDAEETDVEETDAEETDVEETDVKGTDVENTENKDA
jgi:uncharacterized membrane protein YesL